MRGSVNKPSRVLAVLPATEGSNQTPVWARRQLDSLKALGIEVDTFIFKERRSLSRLLVDGKALRRRVHEVGADLVHVHYGSAQALVATLFSPKPVVIS